MAPMVQPTVLTPTFADLEVDGLRFFEFQVDSLSSVAMSLTWTPTASDVDLLLLQGACVSGSCDTANPVANAETLLHPETLTANAVAAGTYTGVIGNFGPDTVAGTLTVTITPS